MVEFFGYDAPPGAVEASSTVMANNGAPKLASFLNGIDAAREHGAGDAHIAVAAHSYGSTTAGIAATLVGDGVIDDLVQFGSPGSGVQDVGEFHVPEGHTYVSAACAPFFGGSMSPRSALRSNPSRPSSATSSPPSSPHAMSFSLLRTSWRTKTASNRRLFQKWRNHLFFPVTHFFLRRAGHGPYPRHLQQVLAAPRIQTLRITLDIGRHQTRELPVDQRGVPRCSDIDDTARRANLHLLLHR